MSSDTKKILKTLDGGKYYIDESGAAFRQTVTRQGSVISDQMSNFALIPTKRVYEHNHPDHEAHIYYEFRPLYKGKLGSPVSFDKDKLRKKNPDVYTHRGERVYPGPGRLADFTDMEFALMDDDEIPEEIRFGFMGLAEIDGFGLVYLNQGHSIYKDGILADFNVALPESYKVFRFVQRPDNLDIMDCIKSTVEILEDVWPYQQCWVILAYVFGSLINYLHYQHGNEDNSILNLVGETGSGKTTLTKFALSLFAIYPHAATATISVADTSVNAMKTLLCSSQFSPVLLDDVRLNETSKDKEKNIAMLNAVTETIGNRTNKQILNGDSTLADSRITHGSVVITSEQELDLSPAANARMTTVKFKRDQVTLRKSFPYQKHLNKINLTGQDFTRYFILNYDRFDQFYDETMEYYINLIPLGGHERISNNITHYMFDFHIWDLYLLDRGFIDQKQFQEREKKMEELFVGLAAEQNDRIKDISPVVLALSRIQANLSSGKRYYKTINSGQTRIPQRFQRLASTSTCMGYIDENKGIMLLDEEETKKALEDYGTFPISMKSLWQMMKDEGLLGEGESRGPGKPRRIETKRSIDGVNMRLIPLKMSAFDKLFNQDDGGDTYEE